MFNRKLLGEKSAIICRDKLPLQLRSALANPGGPSRSHERKHLETIQATIGTIGGAITYSEQGKFAEAEKEYRDVIKLKEKVLGAEHPETLISRNNLANLFYIQRKVPEAEAECRQLVQLEEKVLGPENPNTLISRTNLSLALGSRGAHAEEEKEFREVVAIEEKLLGIEHPDTLRGYLSLAVSLAQQGKIDEAKEFAACALQDGRRVWGPSHAITRAAEKLQNDLKKKQ